MELTNTASSREKYYDENFIDFLQHKNVSITRRGLKKLFRTFLAQSCLKIQVMRQNTSWKAIRNLFFCTHSHAFEENIFHGNLTTKKNFLMMMMMRMRSSRAIKKTMKRFENEKHKMPININQEIFERLQPDTWWGDIYIFLSHVPLLSAMSFSFFFWEFSSNMNDNLQ